VEYAFQMGPMLLVGALTVGLLAEATWRPGGYGLIGDLMTGLAGGLAAGALAWLVTSIPPGMLMMLVLGGAGGALSITGQRTLWRTPTSAHAGSTR